MHIPSDRIDERIIPHITVAVQIVGIQGIGRDAIQTNEATEGRLKVMGQESDEPSERIRSPLTSLSTLPLWLFQHIALLTFGKCSVSLRRADKPNHIANGRFLLQLVPALFNSFDDLVRGQIPGVKSRTTSSRESRPN